MFHQICLWLQKQKEYRRQCNLCARQLATPRRWMVTTDIWSNVLAKSLVTGVLELLPALEIDMYGDLPLWRKLQLIVNHLESGLFRRSDYLHSRLVTHMSIESDGCGSCFPWHVPLKTGRQKETSSATRSYLTFWKLLHILVTHCFSICCGMRIYRFFFWKEAKKSMDVVSVAGLQTYYAVLALALVSVLLISNRMHRCSRRSRTGSRGCYMQTLNHGGGGCWFCSGGVTFFSHAHFLLDALVVRSRKPCSHSNSYCKIILWPSCNAWSKVNESFSWRLKRINL